MGCQFSRSLLLLALAGSVASFWSPIDLVIQRKHGGFHSSAHHSRWFQRSSANILKAAFFPTDTTSAKQNALLKIQQVGEEIGNGSYGTVHRLLLAEEESKRIIDREDPPSSSPDESATLYCIGKRAWTMEDLRRLEPDMTNEKLTDKAKRCKYYFGVEREIFAQLGQHQGLPPYRGSMKDSKGHEWMVFDLIVARIDADDRPAPSLQDLLQLDLKDHHENERHHLYMLSKALGLERQVESESDEDAEPNMISLVATIDVIVEQILETLQFIHSKRVVHRDLKPANLLVAGDGRVYLIDFGSAALLSSTGPLPFLLDQEQTVAISPIYAAPELFVDFSLPSQVSSTFDCFSLALLTCQLLFEYLDERADAGFHQQLAVTNWNLDAWLQAELARKVRPAGLESALVVLSRRPGLWSLLQGLLQADPRNRTTSKEALEKWKEIKLGRVDPMVDGSYLAEVLDSFLRDTCPIPTSRALQYVATFRRDQPLGLLLSEAIGTENKEEFDFEFEHEELRLAWERATEDALPGEVYVQGVVELSQADEMGIFEVGDRLQGVGELPLAEGGFEKVLSLLKDQPKSSKFVTLHFDRKATLFGDRQRGREPISPSMKGPIFVKDQGAWSTRGRRKSQEDRFILHEVHDTKDRSLLLAGVFDGHAGTAAANMAQRDLPTIFTQELLQKAEPMPTDRLLEFSWNAVCDTYRDTCSADGADSCAAVYDPREGTLEASTGAEDVVAGTTASIVALDKKTSILAVLNCGDSRTLVVDNNGKNVFVTTDHKPELEFDRLADGRSQGLGYSVPACQFSRWYLPVGDLRYSVSRSLEGPFATGKGIVSDPDMSLVQIQPGFTVALATDGLWEVMDVEFVSRIVYQLRSQGTGAGDASKTLCSMALERGSSDNVSVIVLYLE